MNLSEESEMNMTAKEQSIPTTPEQALNMAVCAAEHLRKYLPNDEQLSESDKMAIALLETAKRFASQ